jgi:hypothetical protein
MDDAQSLLVVVADAEYSNIKYLCGQIFKVHITALISIKRQFFKLQCTCWYMRAGRPELNGKNNGLNSMQVLALKVSTLTERFLLKK